MSPRFASPRFALVMAALSLVAPHVHANCSQSIMPIFQCGFVGWFAPPPPGSGTVTATWWQLGYGNNLVNNGAVTTPANEGTGIAPAGVFSGNDGGLFPSLATLTDADSVLPSYTADIPNGATCLNYEWSWAGVGVDGCADNPRTTYAVDNDNLLNPYWGGTYGYCPDGSPDCSYQYTTAYQIDYPMAFLLRESSNRFFALAFVASKSRVDRYGVPGGKAGDISEGFFDLAEVTNGDLNPTTFGPAVGKHNIIPWQAVPKPRLTWMRWHSPDYWVRDYMVSWDPIRLVHDGSVRPNPRSLAPLSAGGVGVLDQINDMGGVCRYQVQVAPLVSDPSTRTWTSVGGLRPCPGTQETNHVEFTFQYDVAVRVRTLLGKTPRTTATTLANCRLGSCGDLGFEATDCKADDCVNGPPVLVVGGVLVSEQAVDTVAERNRNAVVVRFRTTSELTVTDIDVLGRGDAVVASVACKQCTSGVGDSYEVLLTPGDLRGSRALRVRLNGPDAVSEPFPIR